MSRDLDRLRTSAEDMMRRKVGSRAARESAKRELGRRARSVGRRLRNAAIAFVAMLFLIIAGIGFGVLGIFTTLLALIGAFILAILVLFLPPGGRRERPAPVIDGGQAVRLDRLAAQTEDYLLTRARALPGLAGPALDRIVDRLRDIEPALTGLSPDTPTGGEAQRLIGQHLPGLIDNFLALPAPDRAFASESSQRLSESLGIVADELDDLCERIGCQRRDGFEVERRFIEARYRDGERLSLDKPQR